MKFYSQKLQIFESGAFPGQLVVRTFRSHCLRRVWQKQKINTPNPSPQNQQTHTDFESGHFIACHFIA